VHIPGRSRAEASEQAAARGIAVDKDVIQRISEFASRYSA
jgi:(2R)-3-sulfolactate dehydrogenase (NADP+)